MTIQSAGCPRLLFRVAPISLESPFGYFCRVVQAHGYDRPQWLLQLAGLLTGRAAREEEASRIAHVLRLEPEEWLAMWYRRIRRPREFGQRSFCGSRKVLGLHGGDILQVAKAGLIRYVQGSEHCFRPGFYFLREDVSRIKHGFEKYTVPVLEYSKAGELVVLCHALISLGRDSGLPAVIRAVMNGSLVPVAYTNRFPGILGYLFPVENLRMYRSVTGVPVPTEGYLNYTEAATRLGWTTTGVIAGLVTQGALRASAGHHIGRSKLVSASQIQRFSNQYMAVKTLAQRLQVTADWLRSHLKKSGTPILAVRVGQGRRAIFLLKELAAKVQIPGPEGR